MEQIGLIIFRRIWLLLWKNSLMRRRHYIVSAFEIILPSLLAAVIVYLRTQIDFGATGAQPLIGPDENGDTGFPVFSELEMLAPLTPWPCIGIDPEYDCVVAYAPNSSIITEFMNNLIDSIEVPFNITYEVKGFSTEAELERYQQLLSIPSGSSDLFLAGIVFDSESLINDQRKVSYKIRAESWRSDGLVTREIFPLFQLPGPNFDNYRRYILEGFIGLQILLDKAIISHLTNLDSSDMSKFVYTSQAMPHPKYPTLDFNQLYQFILPQFTVQGFIFIVPSIIRAVVAEKETGIKELMKMSGLPNWMHWVGWLINSLLVLAISITITVVSYFVVFNSTTGAVLTYSDPTLWWVVLFFYIISGSTFCFLISAFFQKPTLATTVGVILWIVTYQPVNILLEPRYPDLSLVEKMLACLLPNMALHYAFLIMCGFEAQGVGAKWSNIAEPINSNDTLTLLHVLAMFIVNSFLYVVLALYVENIMPTTYGVRRPWYYIFQPSTWYCKKMSSSSNIASHLQNPQTESIGFENEPTDLQVGIDIRGLRKVFGKGKIAVDDVTIKMFHGQITALLGHNGAGKTTAISMITGLFAPTGGKAYVNGYDIYTDMEKVRENLGLCPQHNMLFDKLTVAEHLKFFGRLKGLSVSAAEKEMKELVRQLQLEEKQNVMSMSLSGGQKRKLSLGCALIGGNKVVILDEPTSGMDPEARRIIWDLLLELRDSRTILLTTHFMEEADVLGDRIAIMSDGKLKCCGSPMFLKQFYGAGYTLKMTLGNLALPDRILSAVQHYIPEAYFKSQNQYNSKEISIVLPTSNMKTSVFVPLFKELSSNAEIKSDIETIGLSLTTMDEVFVRVGELNDRHEPVSVIPLTPSEMSLDEISSSRDNLQTKKLSGLRLMCQQFWGLLLKRVLYTSRKWLHFISQLLIPVAVLIVAIVVSNLSYRRDRSLPPLKISFSDYKNPMTMFWSSDAQLSSNFENLTSKLGSSTIETNGNLSKGLLAVGYEDLGLFRSSYVVAAELNSTSFNAMYSTIPNHAAPLSINLISNLLLKSLLPATGDDIIIEVTNHPLTNRYYDLIYAVLPDPQFATNVAVLFSTILPIGLALLAATYIIFAVDERLCKAKQLQLMSGVNPIIYWGSSFVWDYTMMIFVICLMVACFPIFETHKAFTANHGGGVVFLFLAVYGLGAIPFSYLFSLFVGSVPGGFALVTIIHILTGFLNLVIDALNTEKTQSLRVVIRWIARLFPTFGAGACSFHYSKISASNSICELLTDEAKELICVPGFIGGSGTQLCCDNCEELGAPCFKPNPFIIWEDKDTKEPGMGQELIYMLSMAVIYKIILICLELRIFQKIINLIFKTNNFSFKKNTTDEDVDRESERVHNLVLSNSVQNDAMIVQNLSKSYGTFAAVSNLNFGVHHGECFGLLGVNGAGKTTTFRMLTGDELRSDGNAYAGKYNLENYRKMFLSNIGYCPQFDGIIDVLSGREMLQLFGRLRGIPSRLIDSEANKWLRKLGLDDSAKIQCGNYSGGMKRRLSACMAMVGDPNILLLDEPTTGVDPVARRQFWQVINSIRSAGQAIILTSHSMEECEALCTRLGIMVNGEMQCLGGVQHLKNKYAQGYSLTIKLKSNNNSNNIANTSSSNYNTTASGLVQELSAEISQRFNPCALKDQHLNILQYQVYNTSMPWDVLFQIMEEIKCKYIDIIQEYSVSGTTLEEVFLSFARRQYVPRQADVSILKAILTCQCCRKR